MAWTGVGSRRTPRYICHLMYLYAQLQTDDFRSGGADGPDDYFERGAVNCKQHIYLPKRGAFGKHGKNYIYEYDEATIAFAHGIAQDLYPVVFPTEMIRLFMTRNVFQILGLCDSLSNIDPSDYVMCYTPDGCDSIATYVYKQTGGTGMAIMVADKFDVPIYNLHNPKHMKNVVNYLGDNGAKISMKALREVHPLATQLLVKGVSNVNRSSLR